MQDDLVDWEMGTFFACRPACHLELSSCHVESGCLGEGAKETESGGGGRQSEKESGAFCETLVWIRRAAWRFSPLSGNLDPVRAQEWLEEGKANWY